MRYLRIKTEDEDKLLETANKLGISVEVFYSSFEIFSEEEAEYRVELLESIHGEINSDRKRQMICDEVRSEIYDNSEYVIDSDYLEDITYRIAGKIIPGYSSGGNN